jgi:flagellum-specific ATP synthase
MLSKASNASIVVVALVGERGREVREFLDEVLGSNRDNVIAVVATSDESTMMRRLAPLTAMAIAEHFRDSGESVLLLLDSITRFAHAHREYALAAGELPVARGYPASMVAQLAHLLERAGPGEAVAGFITAIVTVLVDGDDHNDPVADSARGLLDGHIVLDRTIAEQGRFPPVDVLASISRLSDKAFTQAQKTLATQLRQLISRFEETRDLRMISGHRPGADPVLDRAIVLVPKIYETLKQDLRGPASSNPISSLALLLQDPAATKTQVAG